MKPSQRYVTLLATASLVLASSALAQSNRPSSAASSSASATTISRVTKDSIKQRFTAKDLIGASVYDSAGEKVGDIADIDLQGAVPGALATAFNTDQAADRAGNRTTPATTTPSAGATASTSSRPMSGDSPLAQATVFLSVGGLLGVGDDLVSVPAAQLNYNAAQDRFELAMAKAEVVARAEGRSTYAADSSTPAATRAGKQSFADEAQRVQSALSADPQTSAFAQKVTVTSAGESLQIHGTVDNKEQRKRILDAARRSTSLDIEDKIEVRD